MHQGLGLSMMRLLRCLLLQGWLAWFSAASVPTACSLDTAGAHGRAGQQTVPRIQSSIRV